MPDSLRWSLLVYKIPPLPTRLRLSVWRRLQKMGALYLQDGVAVVPDRSDLTENLTYLAQSIEEMGGSAHLFAASALLPEDAGRLRARFRELASRAVREFATKADAIEATLAHTDDLTALEEDLRRERVAFLRARSLAFFGADGDEALATRLDTLRQTISHRLEGK